MEKSRQRDFATDTAFNDPDRGNAEQNEDGRQAQDLADEILDGDSEAVADSEHGEADNPADIVPRDVPDLADNIQNMMLSGQIDMSAFEGEENMDDEDEDNEYTRPR